jgi:uncharacterized cupredoxin-like copper-binding protein
VTADLIGSLATGNKIGLAVAAGLFIAFALVSALLIPRSRPDFPSGRGLGVFVLVSTLFFLGTMTAVFTLGKEADEEAHAALTERESSPQETQEDVGQTQTEEAGLGAETQENQPATTSAGNAVTQTITVTGTEFKFTLDQQPTGPGNYEFVFKNAGKIDHDLVVEGDTQSEDRARTPVIGGGEEARIRVPLQSGSYTLLCDVPGHADAGMKLEISVD